MTDEHSTAQSPPLRLIPDICKEQGNTNADVAQMLRQHAEWIEHANRQVRRAVLCVEMDGEVHAYLCGDTTDTVRIIGLLNMAILEQYEKAQDDD